MGNEIARAGYFELIARTRSGLVCRSRPPRPPESGCLLILRRARGGADSDAPATPAQEAKVL